jgi:hypothetical protein
MAKGEINDRLLDILEAQVERSAPKENPKYTAQSLFLKPNGEPWAKDLKCDIYFGAMHLNRDPLTKAEVDALNRLEPLDAAIITKTDQSVANVKVIARRTSNGRIERLTIEAPMRRENNEHLTYPPILVFANELANQAVTPQAAA